MPVSLKSVKGASGQRKNCPKTIHPRRCLKFWTTASPKAPHQPTMAWSQLSEGNRPIPGKKCPIGLKGQANILESAKDLVKNDLAPDYGHQDRYFADLVGGNSQQNELFSLKERPDTVFADNCGHITSCRQKSCRRQRGHRPRFQPDGPASPGLLPRPS